MNEQSTIVRHSLSQITRMREQGQDETNPDAPEAESLGVDFWNTARIVMPGAKTSVHLRMDREVVTGSKPTEKVT